MPTATVKTEAIHLPCQYEFITSMIFLKALVGGYGSGKTLSGARALIHLMGHNLREKDRKRKKRRHYGIILPSYAQGDRMTTPAFIEQLEFFQIRYTERKSHPRYFDIPLLNSRVFIMSAEKPDSLKGPNLSGIWIDEPFIQDELAYETALSRIREPGARKLQMILTGTPEDLNWGYDILKDCPTDGRPIVEAEAGSRISRKQLFQVSTRANRFLDPLYVARLETAFDEHMVQAYIDGAFVAFSTAAVYYNFDPRHNVSPQEWQPGRNTFLTYDFNVDPMSVLIGQWTRRAQGGFDTHIIAEVSPRGSNTEEASRIAANVLHQLGFQRGRDYLEIYGDPAGRARATQADRTDYDIIQAIFPEATFMVENAAPPRKRRFNVVNGMLKNSRGERFVQIDPSCTELIKDLQLCKYKVGTRDEDKSDPKRTHKSDALGYMLCARANAANSRPRARGGFG